MAGLAGASYLTLYPVLLFAPCLLMVLSATGRKEGFGPIFAQCLWLFSLQCGALLWLSYSLVRSWAFLSSVYGSMWVKGEAGHPQPASNAPHSIGVPDLRPNIGLWWYFFIEIFSDFRTFFLAVFQLQIAIFALPIALKWR